MLRFNFPRCLPRTRPAPRSSVRRAARPRLETLEARDVPATLMIRTPYAPYGQPAVVASLPQVEDPQQLTYSIDHNAVGDSVTAWVHVPSTGEPIPGVGVYFTKMNRFGQASAPVLVEGFDFDKSDHYTSGITGDVDVSVNPTGGFAITYVRRVGHFPDPAGPHDSYSDTMVVRLFDANGTLLPEQPPAFHAVSDSDPFDEVHYAIVKPKIGIDNLWGVTGAWQRVVNIDPTATAPGSTFVQLLESRWIFDEVSVPVLTPPEVVAESFLNRGNGSFSEYTGDFILSHDLDANADGLSVVAWDRHIVPNPPLYSAYLTLDAIYRRRINEYGMLLYDDQPDYIKVSQYADDYTATPTPQVAINDSGAHSISWTYAPAYTIPQGQLPAQRGVYYRSYTWNAPAGNEVLVVSSPNSDGRPTYPTPPQFHVGHINHPIAMNNAGNVLVGYYDSASGVNTPHRLRGQLFDGNGNPIGNRFSFFEANSAYALQGVGPDQFRLAMDENGHITTAIGNPNAVSGTWVSVVAQRFVRAEFDVQRGQIQRSTVQFVDITFNPGMIDLAALMAPGRVQLTRYPLFGPPQGTPVSLAGALSYSGNTLTLNFGPGGLADNGYYVLQLDLDGDGVFEMARAFYRKLGDFSGTGLNFLPNWFVLND
jgi:hypothetical protein